VQSPTEVIPTVQADEMGLEGRVIIITSGDQVMQFRQSRVIIGRGKEADLRVNDPNVSRKHAAVYWNNGRLMVDDLGSTNGTMVNGYPVTRTMLRPTDVVAIGESRLTVEGK
jgi:pSer/pThr/pTyr-binding forkhead associated (FHA) protein